MTKPAKTYMRRAIEEARLNLGTMEGGPFGACIVKGRRVLATARNTVLAEDATCHAEVNAIRAASRAVGSYDLSGCRIYSTTEPCPMCFSAIHWARIGSIVYATRIGDVGRLGFNELAVSNRSLKRLGRSPVEIVPGFLREEGLTLLDEWAALEVRQTY